MTICIGKLCKPISNDFSKKQPALSNGELTDSAKCLTLSFLEFKISSDMLVSESASCQFQIASSSHGKIQLLSPNVLETPQIIFTLTFNFI
jgi:hypothetical protein